MKQILLIVALLCGAWCAKAQDMTVATLDSKEGSQSFYGPDAFKDAVSAAQEGDRITLSPGTFTACSIEKSGLTIQGAGCMNDSEAVERTILTGGGGRFHIGVPDKELLDFTIEGVCIDGIYTIRGIAKNFTAKKCRFAYLTFGEYPTDNNINTRIEHCRVASTLTVSEASTNFLISNSIISDLASKTSKPSITALNSVLCSVGVGVVAHFENCIIYGINSGFGIGDNRLTKESTVVRCVSYIPSIYDALEEKNGSICLDENVIQILKEPVAAKYHYSDDASYVLTDEAARKYLGSDNKQVGIYGGYSPYNATPSNPQIVSKKIDERSSNGKLNVEIKVAAQN